MRYREPLFLPPLSLRAMPRPVKRSASNLLLGEVFLQVLLVLSVLQERTMRITSAALGYNFGHADICLLAVFCLMVAQHAILRCT